MNVMELDAFRAELARTILTTEDYDLLDKIKQLIGLQDRKEDTAKEECGDADMTKEEILEEFAQACHELKQRKEGKLRFRTLKEALHEL